MRRRNPRAAECPAAAAAALLVALASCPARAQIYQFEQSQVPDAKSLQTIYAFYIYSHQDAPDRSMGQPFVKFSGLASHSLSAEKPDSEMGKYKGVQLSLLRYKDFWSLVNPLKFCSNTEDVTSGSATLQDQLLLQTPEKGSDSEGSRHYTHAVDFQDSTDRRPKDAQMNIQATGVYILVFSNCGDFKDAQVSGSVIVKNAYGFLPGNEYHKMPFYGWLSLVYAGMAVVWMGRSLQYWRSLFHIQYCIAAVIFLGLVEAFFWWIFFNDWNHSGVRGRFLFVMAIFTSVIKSIFSYMLVLVASLGWGITRPYLDNRTIMKVQALTSLYIVLDFVREAVLSFRHSHSLSLPFLLLCLLPVALLNGTIFYWIFTALSSLMEQLRERQQTDKLLLFERLWQMLVLALSVASLTLLFQIIDLSRSISIRWHYQWFFADGVSHILFLMVLTAMMYLWAPSTNSERFAYGKVGEDEESAKPDAKPVVWANEEGEDDLDQEDEDDSFWATTHGKSIDAKVPKMVAADTIGIATDPDAAAAERS